EQRLLRRALGELAAQRLTGVLQGVVHQGALFPASGNPHRDLAAEARGERFLDQRRLARLMAQQDQPRRRAVLVELTDEGLEHFGVRKACVGAWPVGVVAPVLVGAEADRKSTRLNSSHVKSS